ncbi:MAG: septal ring lytic transglycosylase RlpA family protein [Patescibacteria group bacterium]|nr:septal ring lytic transglycosylase RlpA family protein [Patescibacteria group bacterium]MDD5490684.1 septal ring lytic transglycosylase RlpA family protein [Patescibacteria group bacterium]
MRYHKILFFLFSFYFLALSSAQAEETDFFYSLKIDGPTLSRGYTIKTLDGFLTLGIMPGAMEKESAIEFKNLSTYLKSLGADMILPDWAVNFPENIEPISDIYEFNILNKESFRDKRPLVLELGYKEEINNLKKIYFWDGSKGEWRELPSQSLSGEKKVRARIHLPYARLAVFANSHILEEGEASWYKYKNCDCAASPDYPKGTLLKVTNLENNKSVTVKVNDYGPDRSIFPARIIDLDKVAFKKLANLRAGIIKKVGVELIKRPSGK